MQLLSDIQDVSKISDIQDVSKIVHWALVSNLDGPHSVHPIHQHSRLENSRTYAFRGSSRRATGSHLPSATIPSVFRASNKCSNKWFPHSRGSRRDPRFARTLREIPPDLSPAKQSGIAADHAPSASRSHVSASEGKPRLP